MTYTITNTEAKLFKFLLELDQTQEMLKEWAEDQGHGYPEKIGFVDDLATELGEMITQYLPENKRELLITDILD